MKMKNLRGQCQHCGGRFDFPVAQIGTMGDCPLCGQSTEMMLERPKIESDVPKRIIVFSIVAILILGLGLLAAMVALKRAQVIAQKPNSREVPGEPRGGRKASAGAFAFQTNDFHITSATIQKDLGAPLPLAVGILSNDLNRPRLGVQLTFDVLDAAGRKVGSTKDSVILVEPFGKWQFRAPLLQTNAASVRLAGIREEKQP